MSDEYWEDKIMKEQEGLALSELMRQRDELAKALKYCQPWLEECRSVDEMGLPEQNDPLENTIEFVREALRKAGVE